MKVGLGPGHTVLDGDPAPPTERGTAAPHFSAHVTVAKRSPILATAMLLFFDTKDLNENQIRSPSTAGAPNTYGVGKICDYQPKTQKRYKIVAYLL